MTELPAAPNDTETARVFVDQRVGNAANVTLIIRTNAPPEFLTRARQAEGAGAGRLAIAIKSGVKEILGEREAAWFGTDPSICAVSLRGVLPADRLKAAANLYEVNRAFLKAEAQ